MRFKSFFTLATIAAVAAANAAIVFNGNFTGKDGAPSSEGWTLNESTEVNPYHDRNNVRGGTNNGLDGLLTQEIALQAGKAYRLTFDAFGNQGPGSGNRLNVTLGDDLIFFRDNDLSSDWTTYTTEFTAGSASLLGFTFRDRYSSISVTNVSVEAVPEPATCAAVGLGALGLLRRRKR